MPLMPLIQLLIVGDQLLRYIYTQITAIVRWAPPSSNNGFSLPLSHFIYIFYPMSLEQKAVVEGEDKVALRMVQYTSD